MQFEYRYAGFTGVNSDAGSTAMSFAPDTLREPTYFYGKLSRKIPFREAISALHDVVISDLRFKPKDKTAYKQWAAQRDEREVGELLQNKPEVQARFQNVSDRLVESRKRLAKMQSSFRVAQQEYFNYLYKHDYNAWFVLDPVITVHPDELFFECFSEDESTYGRLGCNYEVFKEVGEFACGTTNIDYSASLYDEFQKIRDYKDTDFKVDPSGFEVQTGLDESYRQLKIDLPHSWVRGFLQVSAAMTLPARVVKLDPMDVHNFCFILRRHKEKTGPRSMRYVLKPGQPVKVIFEPWGLEVICSRSIYQGREEDEIRVWGRRRLHILERLLPVAHSVTLHLMGNGMPSFYVVDMGAMNFTLGLSGWTANDWSKSGNFDLMAPRAEVDDYTRQQVFKYFKQTHVETADALSQRLNLDRELVLASLAGYTQAGRVMYDLANGVYRVRELSREPLPLEQLRFASPREAEARKLVDGGRVKLTEQRLDPDGNLNLAGKMKSNSRVFKPECRINADDALRQGSCSCDFFFKNKLYKGPCAHMLALRMIWRDKQKGGNRW